MYTEQKQIYWHSGLYLQPQHFQSMDLHTAWLHARQLQLAQPYNFGIIELTYNASALKSCTLIVESMQAITPDGNYLAFPGNCSVQKRDFDALWTNREKPLTFWLALRRFDPLHCNVTLPNNANDNTHTRWVGTCETQVMKDIYDLGPDATITRLHYNVQFLTDSEKENALECECLPVLRLVYDGENIVCDPRFIPPSVIIHSSPLLRSLVDSIFFELSARTRKLEEYKRNKRQWNSANSDEQIIQLLTMRSLGRILPALRNHIHMRQCHPREVYIMLSQLIGELSAFNNNCNYLGETREYPEELACYDHYQLYKCFSKARKTILYLLNNLIFEDNSYIKLHNEDGVYCGNMTDTKKIQKSTVLLQLRTERVLSREQWLAISNNIKLAPLSMIHPLIRHALPGVPITHCEQPPNGVPAHNDAQYFTVQHNSELWRKIEDEQCIAFCVPDAPDDLSVQIIFKEDR
ncbi:type VI secretion system baseplate subunit TssK [Salmonella enterica]|nr:type VI secretion system baseplate subunit TssK [Salmonella enterica]EGW2853019.1 type VI secretion system baseplate subunit TssK [Salmonella enterica]